MSMRKWTISLTFMGLGGLGAMLFTERGRKLIRSGAERLGATRGRLAAWNGPAQEELGQIQQAVKEIEQSLGTQTAR